MSRARGPAADGQRLTDRGCDPRGGTGGACLGADPLTEDHELVAAEARDRVCRCDRRGDPAADLAQRFVGRLPAKLVVDFLEAVEVDCEHRAAAPARLRLGQAI